MASCNTFVSLIRSCYTTRMRFFRDDLSIELPVKWVFTDPKAKWCGLANVFNSRNWYLTDPDQWPDLGEVQGAARPYSKGDGRCPSQNDVLGSADQWANGALGADAMDVDPCKGPLVQAFGETGCFFEENGGTLPGVRFSPDVWYAQSFLFPGNFYTLARNALGPGCCADAQGTVSITDGPPAFNDLGFGPFQIDPAVSGCASCQYVSNWFVDHFRVEASPVG